MKFRPQFSIANLIMFSIAIGCALGWYLEWRKHADDIPVTINIYEPHNRSFMMTITSEDDRAVVNFLDEIRIEPIIETPAKPLRSDTIKVYLPEGK